MIVKIKKLERTEEKEEIFKKLVEDFNKEAIAQGMKHRLMIAGGYPKLIKPLFLGIGDGLGENQILYSKLDDVFYFFDGVNEESFMEAKSIFESIEQRFIVEVL